MQENKIRSLLYPQVDPREPGKSHLLAKHHLEYNNLYSHSQHHIEQDDMSSENSYKILDKMAARRGSDLIQSRYKLTSGAYVGYSDFNHMTLQPIKQNM